MVYFDSHGPIFTGTVKGVHFHWVVKNICIYILPELETFFACLCYGFKLMYFEQFVWILLRWNEFFSECFEYILQKIFLIINSVLAFLWSVFFFGNCCCMWNVSLYAIYCWVIQFTIWIILIHPITSNALLHHCNVQYCVSKEMDNFFFSKFHSDNYSIFLFLIYL